MNDLQMDHYWRGRRLIDLAREELLEVCEYLANEVQRYTTPEAIQDRAAGQAARFMRPAFPYENPRTPAETEAMLNHMADVHLTPTNTAKSKWRWREMMTVGSSEQWSSWHSVDLDPTIRLKAIWGDKFATYCEVEKQPESYLTPTAEKK